jgi:hypothetical protein
VGEDFAKSGLVSDGWIDIQIDLECAGKSIAVNSVVGGSTILKEK